jgi:pSer/pThr/pTyr-binding forkhead associated (FHA) protein
MRQIKIHLHFFRNPDIIDEDAIFTIKIGDEYLAVQKFYQAMLTRKMHRWNTNPAFFGTPHGECALKNFMGNNSSIIKFEGEFHRSFVYYQIGRGGPKLDDDCKIQSKDYNDSMDLQIKLITGENLNFKVEKDSFVIGRSGQCDVVIAHESISRRHCQIDYHNGDLYVTDLGSINGVSVDGEKIEPEKPIKFQSYFPLSFGAVQSLIIDMPEERTSVQVNPLLATTLPKEKPRIHKIQSAKTVELPHASAKKRTEVAPDKSMNNFFILCVVVIFGLAAFIFRDEFMSLLE